MCDLLDACENGCRFCVARAVLRMSSEPLRERRARRASMSLQTFLALRVPQEEFRARKLQACVRECFPHRRFHLSRPEHCVLDVLPSRSGIAPIEMVTLRVTSSGTASGRTTRRGITSRGIISYGITSCQVWDTLLWDTLSWDTCPVVFVVVSTFVRDETAENLPWTPRCSAMDSLPRDKL